MDERVTQHIKWSEYLFDTTRLKDSVNLLPHRADRWSDIFSSQGALVDTSKAITTYPLHDWVLPTASVIILAIYCWLIYRYAKPIKISLKAFISIEYTFFIFENLTKELKRFFNYAMLTMVISIALLITVATNELGSVKDTTHTLLLFTALGVYIYISFVLQYVLRWLVSLFDSSPERMTMIHSLTRLNLSTIAIVFCPVMIVLCNIDHSTSIIMALGCFAIAIITHWIRLFKYFKLTGFSILQWFLYLCTLEAVPYTVIYGIIQHIGVL